MIPPSTSTLPATTRVQFPRQPMLWAAIAFALGIVAGVYEWRPALWWIVAELVFAGATVYFASRRLRFSWILALSIFFLIGAFEAQIRGAATQLDTGIVPYVNGEALEITGHVVRDGRVQAAGRAEVRQSLDVEAENIRTDSDEIVPIHSRIRLNIYEARENDESVDDYSVANTSDTPMHVFQYGERLRFFSKLRLPRNFRNRGRSTIAAIWQTAALPSSVLQKARRCNLFLDSQATSLIYGGAGRTRP